MWQVKGCFFCEVHIQLMSSTTVIGSADVVSGILNWVCPGCGGRIGGDGKEFKCQGECQTDGRQIWERGSFGTTLTTSGRSVSKRCHLMRGGEKAGLDRERLLAVLSKTAVVAPAHVGKLAKAAINAFRSGMRIVPTW